MGKLAAQVGKGDLKNSVSLEQEEKGKEDSTP
jgi:hypothetical protein